MKLLRTGLLLLFLLVGREGSAQELRFAAPEYQPYTGEVQGQATGVGVAMVEEIITRAGMRMSVHIVPNYSRCVFEVSHQIADGFFLGSRNAERDAVAVLSRPVLINRWVWVTRKEASDKPAIAKSRAATSMGVMLNTNPHIWLKEHGYHITGTPNTGVSLVAMLDAGRFDKALVPELVFQYAVQQSGRNLGDYNITLHSSQAFGIYLAKDFLQRHPEALTRINQAIDATAASRSMAPKPAARK